MDKELLFKSRVQERDVDVDGVGTVRVRALTRGEAMSFRGVHDDPLELEVRMLAVALVDPVLTEDEVRRWQDGSPAGELQAVVDVVIELSGMRKEVGGEHLRRFPE